MKHLLALIFPYFRRKRKEKEEAERQARLKDREQQAQKIEYPFIMPCMPIMPPDFFEHD